MNHLENILGNELFFTHPHGLSINLTLEFDMLEFLEIDCLQTGELDSSLEVFLTSHRGKLAGKGGQLGSTSMRCYIPGLWGHNFSSGRVLKGDYCDG